MGALDADAGPLPNSLAAVTVKVYPVPPVSPVTVQLGVDAVHVLPPGLLVTVYEVMPPGTAAHDTSACSTPPVATGDAGAAAGGAP